MYRVHCTDNWGGNYFEKKKTEFHLGQLHDFLRLRLNIATQLQHSEKMYLVN